MQTISLQQEADFGANDATLGQDAQHQLGQLVLLMRGKAVVKLTVRPFSGPMETKALALERGRSIKAALTLHGANPDIIVVEPGQLHEGRSGEVQLTVEHVQR